MLKLNPENVFDPSRTSVKQKHIFKISKEPNIRWPPSDAVSERSDVAMQSSNQQEEMNFHDGDFMDDTSKQAVDGQLLRLQR